MTMLPRRSVEKKQDKSSKIHRSNDQQSIKKKVWLTVFHVGADTPECKPGLRGFCWGTEVSPLRQ